MSASHELIDLFWLQRVPTLDQQIAACEWASAQAKEARKEQWLVDASTRTDTARRESARQRGLENAAVTYRDAALLSQAASFSAYAEQRDLAAKQARLEPFKAPTVVTQTYMTSGSGYVPPAFQPRVTRAQPSSTKLPDHYALGPHQNTVYDPRSDATECLDCGAKFGAGRFLTGGEFMMTPCVRRG